MSHAFSYRGQERQQLEVHGVDPSVLSPSLTLAPASLLCTSAPWSEAGPAPSRTSLLGPRGLMCTKHTLSSQRVWRGSEHPQDVPLWHEDYFELKAIENQQMQEKSSSLPLSAQKQGIPFPLWRCHWQKWHLSSPPAYCTRKRRATCNTRDGGPAQRWGCINKPH